MNTRRIILALLCTAVLASAQKHGNLGLIMLSIDGLRPDYILETDQHGLRIPNLRQLLHQGAHASKVTGVLPTVTYPSHTTMITGVWPDKHGIYANETFDPLAKNKGGWNWYSEDIKVPTLWQAAAKAGYTVGSVSWPVSVSAPGVRYLIPEYWRAMTPEDLKLLRALSTPGLFSELERRAGPYTTDLNDAIPGDWARTHYAKLLLEEKRVDFLTFHFAALDHLEHEGGPFSQKANAALEEIDQMVGILEKALQSKHSEAITCIVSDHGFANVEHVLSLTKAFVDAGLIRVKGHGNTLEAAGVEDWVASPWLSGGGAAIMLRDRNDPAARAKVKELLDRLAAEPGNGIAAVLDRDAIHKFGGNPEAEFFVDMRSGWALTPQLGNALLQDVSKRGTHGYAPDHPELKAFFMIAGADIRSNADLGAIDMRSIAPTVAHLLGVTLPTADLPALPVSAR